MKEPQGHKFPIVAIGSSAGGLDAITQLLARLPKRTGMAFVVLQHLFPKRESLSVEILGRVTRIPVCEVKSGTLVEQDRIYVLPPGHEMTIFRGVLHLEEREDTHQSPRVIDQFLRSLAEEQKTLAIGIVLSGAANDGTAGLRAIKAEGGLSFAQDPKTSQYGGMPTSAINAGVVDMVLSPGQIGDELARLASHPHFALREIAEAKPAEALALKTELKDRDPWTRIFSYLRTQTRVDFSDYKSSTLKRRISKRMFLRRMDSLKTYADYLRENPEEVKSLFSDILINVTCFFRDQESYKALEKLAFPRILKDLPKGAAIRIWVPGCASGEETYSLAISLLEYLGRGAADFPIQIFSSDISEPAIQKARRGVYSEESVEQVPKAILERYFTKTDSSYKINKAVRDLCLFSRHDVMSDPPFAKVDLISCRNLLIYFSAALQKRVLPIFHYALNPGGILWLGHSETTGSSAQLFNTLDKSFKIFQRNEGVAPASFRFPVRTFIHDKSDVAVGPPAAARSLSALDLQKEYDRVAATRFGPSGVVLDERYEIIQVRGETYPYLKIPPGVVSHQIFKMARLEIGAALRKLVREVEKTNAPARKNNVRYEYEGKMGGVTLEVVPVTGEKGAKGRHYLVFFERVDPKAESRVRKGSTRLAGGRAGAATVERLEHAEQKVQQLEQELAMLRESQQAAQEDRDTSHEEFTSANEELQSMNEELQSTNEELETAKEELQSTNEELTTVNDELQTRNADLGSLTDDLLNFLGSVEIPIVMVDASHKIRRFTPMASKLLNLIEADVGRLMSNIKSNLTVSNLEPLVSEVLQKLQVREQEIQDTEGHWYRLQIRPYRTGENKIDGAVLAFLDVDALKRAYDSASASETKYRAYLESAYDAIVTVDRGGKICVVNKQAEKWFGYDRSELIGKEVEILVPSAKRERHAIERQGFVAHPSSRPMGIGMELQGQRKDGGVFPIEVSLSPVETPEGLRVIAMIREISGRKKLEEERNEIIERERRAKEEAERGNRAKDLFLATLSHELRTPLTAILSWAQILRSGRIDTAGMAKGLEIVEESALTQNQLITDLLDVSRIIMGKLSIEKQESNLVTVLDNAINAVRPLAEKRNIAIETKLESTAAYVLADPTRLRQIFWNLLNNAIKFTPARGKISVILDVSREGSQPSVTVRFQDTGKGISSEFVPHLFDRFFQADSSSVRAHGGLGLGLAIVRSLVELHGGSVKAESQGEGKGSTFLVTFPLIAAPALAAPGPGLTTETPGIEGTIAGLPLKDVRILLVDDEEKAREAIKVTLSLFGAAVELASSAMEGFEALRKSPPDLLICDIAMPGEDGFSLIRKIRALRPVEGGKVPAVALTAYAGSANHAQALSSGFQVHLAKPVEAKVLLRAILEILGTKADRAARAAM